MSIRAFARFERASSSESPESSRIAAVFKEVDGNYLNRQFDGATVDPYPHQFTMYLTLGIVNTIEVYAVDEAGNRSAAATMTIDLRTPCFGGSERRSGGRARLGWRLRASGAGRRLTAS